jgi:LPS export ABC transporter permease LptF/LPS export ABC transporter permease LptG
MRLIDRYVYRQVFSHALLGLLIFTFVFFVPQLVRLMEVVVRHSASPARLTLLFACTFPRVFTFTLPISVLVGVLIGLGRMSADSELIALSALGIGLRRVLLPVGVLAGGMAALTLVMTLWASPAATRITRLTEQQLMTSNASFEIQPRVFDERFPHTVMYVEDATAAGTHWKGVLMAEAGSGSDNAGQLTLAEQAIVVPDPREGKLDLHLQHGTTHEYAPAQPDRYSVTTFGESDWPIELNAPGEEHTIEARVMEFSIRQLLAVKGSGQRDARVELNERFALPIACFVFALLAVPLSARPHRGGRAMGFLVSVALVLGYYLLLVIGGGFARQAKISAGLGAWAPNIVMAIVGLALLPGMERIRGESAFARWIEDVREWFRDRRSKRTAAATAATSNGPVKTTRGLTLRTEGARPKHNHGFPQLMDWFLLRNFLLYLTVILVSFIFLSEVFTFFDLLDDIARHHTAFIVVADYFRYYALTLFYQLAPLAALVAALVTMGVLTKNNEVVAFKAGGVSLYRLALPLVIASCLLAGGLLVLDNTYLPYVNQREEALRNEIKARPAQTYLRPNRSWIFGENHKIYNYEFFDSDRNLFGGLNVFELDPQTFELRRRVHAERAVWSPEQDAWMLENGWVRDFEDAHIEKYVPFDHYTLSELSEPPSYFNREVRQYTEMNWRDLESYIHQLQQAGFDVARLTVQWHEKLAFPLIAPVITLLAIPFAILVGTRGAVGGLAVGVGVAICYWGTSALFEALGGVGQLPPLLAGWAPDAIFGFLAIYFFLKMPT